MIGLTRNSKRLIFIAATAIGLWIGAGFSDHSYGQENKANEVTATTGTDQKMIRIVRIFATGEAKVGADSAVVSLTMRVESTELGKAVERSSAEKSVISKKLKFAGIADADIVFENFASDTETGFLTNKVRKYTVNNPIRVTVRKESQFAAVALIVDAEPELIYAGRSAEVSDRTKPQMEAASDAVKNLKQKIALYEKEFDVNLTLLSFEELLPGQNTVAWNFQPPGVGSNSVPMGSNSLTSGLRSGANTISQDGIDGLISRQGSFGELTASVQLQGIYIITQ